MRNPNSTNINHKSWASANYGHDVCSIIEESARLSDFSNMPDWGYSNVNFCLIITETRGGVR